MGSFQGSVCSWCHGRDKTQQLEARSAVQSGVLLSVARCDPDASGGVSGLPALPLYLPGPQEHLASAGPLFSMGAVMVNCMCQLT